ncbi:MAG: DinB family protein [Anaerolineae bacterium]
MFNVHPQADEYAPYYGNYIRRVPQGADLFALLERQPADLRSLLKNVTDRQAGVRPAPGEWSIKEVIGHMCDAERIFAYRALSISRGDKSAFPGFEQDDYVKATNFNARALADLIDEFLYQRRANVLYFRGISEAELNQRGTASDKTFSTRALLYAMAGHADHHFESLRVDYRVDDEE